MICNQVAAGGGEEALPIWTGTMRFLLFAGGRTEIGGRPADIMDIALEIGGFGHALCLREKGLVAACLDNAPLMKGQGAEGAATEAAAIRD